VLTAYENVELPLLLAPLSKQQRKEHVDTALRWWVSPTAPSTIRASSRAGRSSASPSRGDCHRSHDPRGGRAHGRLDRKSAEEILTLLERLNKEFKKTIVMVTHDPHAAERRTRCVTSTRRAAVGGA